MSRLLLVAAVVLLGSGVAGLWLAQRWYTTPQAQFAHQTILIAPGTTFSVLVRQWQQRALIDRPRYWRLAGRLSGLGRKIQAGEYALKDSVSPRALLAQLSRGEGLITYQVQLLEGWTLGDVRRALAAAQGLGQTLQATDDANLLAALGFEPAPAEGWFFPDTYAYHRSQSDRDILLRAHRRMQKELVQAWAERAENLPYKTPYEALVMASIIEKESGRVSDRLSISQVFVRRLKLGMKLQTDPTVIYGVGDAFDGNLTRRHLRTDSPYNTYTRFGLPPTPISLAGRDSLRAALNPAIGDYLYFVARGDGSSEFSRTLAEHNAAVRRYQLMR